MVINTGAIGVWNMANETPMSKTELEHSIGMEITPETLLVTLHPATLDTEPVASRIKALLAALDRFPASHIIFTYPNNDPEGSVIIESVNRYVDMQPRQMHRHPFAWTQTLLVGTALCGSRGRELIKRNR